MGTLCGGRRLVVDENTEQKWGVEEVSLDTGVISSFLVPRRVPMHGVCVSAWSTTTCPMAMAMWQWVKEGAYSTQDEDT